MTGWVGAYGDCFRGPLHESTKRKSARLEFTSRTSAAGWKRVPPACYRAWQSQAQTINSSSSLRKNSRFGSVLKGRGFKPRRKCDKIDPALATEAAPQTAMPLFQHPLLGKCSYGRRYGPRLASRSANSNFGALRLDCHPSLQSLQWRRLGAFLFRTDAWPGIPADK